MQTIHDNLDESRAAALHATLGLPGPVPTTGKAMPEFWHQIYFWDAQPPQNLGYDSHVRTGLGLIPDLELPRRMWAGGQLEFHAPIVIGQPAKKRSTVTDVSQKTGRSGALGFVTVRHEIIQNGVRCLTEMQDLVFREPANQSNAVVPPTARTDGQTVRRETFDSTVLFRYSALTFNGHRIHYDQDFCRQTEGYPDLVVHGPLLAQYLLMTAQAQIGEVKTFKFQATAPLFAGETAEFRWDDGDLWVVGPDGRKCMEASAS